MQKKLPKTQKMTKKIIQKKPIIPKIMMTQKEIIKEKKRRMQKKLPTTQKTMKKMIQKKLKTHNDDAKEYNQGEKEKDKIKNIENSPFILAQED